MNFVLIYFFLFYFIINYKNSFINAYFLLFQIFNLFFIFYKFILFDQYFQYYNIDYFSITKHILILFISNQI